MLPMAPCRRLSFHQWTHSAVASSTSHFAANSAPLGRGQNAPGCSRPTCTTRACVSDRAGSKASLWRNLGPNNLTDSVCQRQRLSSFSGGSSVPELGYRPSTAKRVKALGCPRGTATAHWQQIKQQRNSMGLWEFSVVEGQ